MNENFADWYRAASLMQDRDTLILRWNGVEATLKKIDKIGPDLVRYVFGRHTSSEFATTFKKEFKEADPSFPMEDNETEILTLAGCALAAAMELDSINSAASVSRMILTASMSSLRQPKVQINLIQLAKTATQNTGIKARTRPTLSKRSTININKADIDTLIKPTIDSPNNPATNTTAIQGLAGKITDIASWGRSLDKLTNDFCNLISVQDEELEILWWLIGNWSTITNTPFEQLSSDERPLILSHELFNMTIGKTEPPALEPILLKSGVSEKFIEIPKAVMACNQETLSKLNVETTFCPTLTPVHLAISRALEAIGSNEWVTGWCNACGIKAGAKISEVNLALQFYREHLILADL